METEGSWEYNAPQFVDFLQAQPDHDDENVEQYFDIDHESEQGTASFYLTPSTVGSPKPYKLRSNTNTPSGNTPKTNTPKMSASVTPNQPLKDSNTPRRSLRLKDTPKGEAQEKENQATPEMTAPQPASIKKFLGNICTSLEEWNRDKPKQQQAKAGVKRSNSLSKAGKTTATHARKTSIERISTSPKPATKKLKRSSSAVSLNSKPMTTTTNKPPPRQASVDRHQRKASVERHQRKASVDLSENKQRARQPTRSRASDTSTHARSLSAQRHSGKRSAAPSRSHSIEGKRRDSSTKEDAKKPKPKLTMPITPAVLLRPQNLPADAKTSEQRQIEEIERLRKELAAKRKLAKESHKQAMTATSYVPVKSTQAITRAESFNFATDARLKAPANDGKRGRDSEKDFVANLRSGATSPNRSSAPKRTVPAPFHFHEDKKRKRGSVDSHEDEDSAPAPYKSLAEQLRSYSRRTPDRFRSKPHRVPDNSFTKKQKSGPEKVHVTIPKTPNFETRGRQRPTNVLSQAEIDAREEEEIKKYKFKANPVNDKILRQHSALPKVAHKEPTAFASFNLTSDSRVKDRRHNKSQEEEAGYEFHANPVPSRILQGTVGVKEPVMLPITRPESPAFVLKNRLRSFKPAAAAAAEDHGTQQTGGPRAKPVPHLGIPFQPKLDHRHTEIQAFSFEDRTRKMIRHKESKIQQVYEEEKKAREFHANPLPSDTPDQLPMKRTKSVTKAEPFLLEVDHRGSQKVDEWEHKMEEEMRQQRQLATFRAKPTTVLHKEPFQPKRSNKNLTDHQEFALRTERRGERWAELERYRHEKEVELDQQQREELRRRRQEEEREVKRLRQTAVHKAANIRHYKPVEVRASNQPLTQPETPRFSQRLKSRTNTKC